MLSSLGAKNYRNLNMDAAIGLDPLTIFVGPNGSGKTNLVRVLRFLQDALTGAPDERRGVNSFEDALARFGASDILDARVSPPAVVDLKFGFRLEDGCEHGLDLQLAVQDENSVTVRGENLHRKDLDPAGLTSSWYYQAHTPNIGHGLVWLPIRNEQDRSLLATIGELPTNQLAFNSILERLENYRGPLFSPDEAQRPQESPNFFEGHRLLLSNVKYWSFYDSSRMSLEAVRRSSPQTGQSDTVLAPDGENLVLVLHNLSGDDVDFEDRMTACMTELFPQTRKLRVRTVGRVALSLEWHTRDVERPFYLDEMSDGTVRMLCWASVLFSPKPSTLIVLDEPEAGLHPAWLRVLAGWIRDAASRTQIILSTHSPDLLDYFTDIPEAVRVFHPSGGASTDGAAEITIGPVSTEAFKEKSAEGWHLGDLYRVGDPAVGGWPW